MMTAAPRAGPWHLWVVAILTLLWNGSGAITVIDHGLFLQHKTSNAGTKGQGPFEFKSRPIGYGFKSQ